MGKISVITLFLLLTMSGCSQKDTHSPSKVSAMKNQEHKHTNELINETSPYLLQHAHNPVDWYPWGEKALKKAEEEGKMLLISIGYSACHWCHVMEHECFEEEEVAQIMNDKFVCVKVDREERPDVDQIYMTAIHVMGQNGGWPLNFFATPDGRPFWGGTYFPKAQWLEVLEKVDNEWKNNKLKVNEYADNLTAGLRNAELIPLNLNPPIFNRDVLDQTISKWKEGFDMQEGGRKTSRNKFPIPNNYQFLLRYWHFSKDEEVLKHVKLTLDKIAFGGIYDQLGGGFARYSTDRFWKAPHFEKMLYDNAQLVSLYSEAYLATANPLYKKAVYETLAWVELEMTDETGAFYSALDADSEGEEGKFYVWSEEEIQKELGEKSHVFMEYYNVGAKGKWEGRNILLRDKSDEEVAKKFKITPKALNDLISKQKAELMKVRDQRIRPGLDDKSLTSWNGLMLKAYTDAYQVFGEHKWLDAAEKSAKHITERQRTDDGGLWHSYKKGRSTITGYLEDYCFSIEGLIGLYEATFNEHWLNEAKKLCDYTVTHFYDQQSRMFFFTSNEGEKLVARKMELTDNVIPSSNSSMAKSLFLLGNYFENKTYLNMAETMLNNVQSKMPNYGSGYSNWGMLMLNYLQPFYEIAIAGPQADKKRTELNQKYIPNKMYIGTKKASSLPLLEGKLSTEETRIYVCLNKVCQLPVIQTTEALKQIQ